jgi:RNA polymerase sigma-70 factor (ECF subfamily)
MTDLESLVGDLGEGRKRFLSLVGALRPDLHRYCARMTGSIADGEDVVQETLARAYYTISELETLPPMRPWLFRIAHNCAVDYLRRYERRMSEPLESAADLADDSADAEDALLRAEAVHAAISRFVELAPAQRSCIILKDVLDHSLEEIAALLELSIPAVKAALHRGREGLRERRLAQANKASKPGLSAHTPYGASATTPAPSAVVARYAELFNARDWDGVRSLLTEDVRLDLVNRSKRSGRREVGGYFTNYGALAGWYLVPARLDGSEIIAVLHDPGDTRAAYFMELTLVADRVAAIRDFRYVPYIANEAAIELAGTESAP